MNQWWLVIVIITAIEGQSFNQPTLCSSATWNPNAITVAGNSPIQGYPNTIFLDQNNSIYLTSNTMNRIEIWSEGNTSHWRQIATGLNQSRGLVVSLEGEIFVDNGISCSRVERWTWNASNATSVMNINGSCFSLFLGPNDTLYCSLTDSHLVISSSLHNQGTIPTRIAGTGVVGLSASTLYFPRGIFVDSSENLYIADSGNNRIQLFSPGETNGTTVAGNGIPDNLFLQAPIGILLDADGSLFILEEGNSRIIRAGMNRHQCIAGCVGSGNGPAQLSGPSSFQFDNLGNLFVVDRNNVRIQKFVLASNSCGPSYNLPRLSPCASWNADAITIPDNSTVGSHTTGIFVDTNNTLYTAVQNLHLIRIWTEGSLAPTRTLTINSTTPLSIFATSNGNIYANNGAGNRRVDKWTVNSSTPVSVMTVPESCSGIFVDVKENLYCSFSTFHYVMRRSLMDPINRTTVVAGNRTAGAALNQLHIPRGLFVDLNLNLYVADCHNNRVLRLASGHMNATAVVGLGAPGTIDLLCPIGIALDADDYLFITDFYNHRIVGSGPNGFRCLLGCSGVSGLAANQLFGPWSLSFDRYGNLFVADSYNNRIQRFLVARNTCSLSVNQPIFCANASWNSRGNVLMNTSRIGSGLLSSFVDLNNTIYVASPSRQEVQVWFSGDTSPSLVLLKDSNTTSAIFAAINGDIFVEDGTLTGRVDRWAWNFNTSIPAMFIAGGCISLFIDMQNQLYCSQNWRPRVIRNSYLGKINQTEIVAGNGSVGFAANMLDGPRGIFVDLNMTLYVADCYNDRVQMFRRGERNGITLAGNGSSGTIALNRPIAVILDGNGYLFITDASNDRIIASGPNGFRCIVGCGAGLGALNHPRTVHFDSDGNLLVVESGNRRLQKFLLASNSCEGTTASTLVTQTTMIATEYASYPNTTGTTPHSLHPFVFLPSSCSNATTTGTFCNISSSPCDLLQPCSNNGTCDNTNLTKYGYMCRCPSRFDGAECQLDHRPCQPDTCWNQGVCHPNGSQSFLCLCANGWEGDHCETQVNLCRNVQCLNGGVCRPSFLNYTCECLGQSYSGGHCEITSSETIIRQRLSKSFAYIAIIAMVSVAVLIVTMDVLKYGFGIDPAKEELDKMEKTQKAKGKRTIIAIRYLYVHSSMP